MAIKVFPGTVNPQCAADAQPDLAIIQFCEYLTARARAGEIRAIAIAIVEPGRVTADAWRRAAFGPDTSHELMAAITYLQLRYGQEVNESAEAERR